MSEDVSGVGQTGEGFELPFVEPAQEEDYGAQGDEYVSDLGASVDERTGGDGTLTLGEYVGRVLENPDRAGFTNPGEYWKKAIESHGTRPVIEEGEQKERYVFFDDPANDGEHAVFGHTGLLNRFVNEYLSNLAKDDDAMLPLFIGPTATGKTELALCCKDNLTEFSQTDEGRLYTIKVRPPDEYGYSPDAEFIARMFGGNPDSQQVHEFGDWESSPTRADPLTVLGEYDEDVADRLEADINEEKDAGIPTRIRRQLDPVSKMFLDEYREQYDDFQEAIEDAVEVVPVDVADGNGVGEILSTTNTSQRMGIDTLMLGGYTEMEKSPLTFSYDGAFCAGNRLMVRMDDADQYANRLTKLNNYLDANEAKLPRLNYKFSIDTVPILIANPSVEEVRAFADIDSKKDMMKMMFETMDDSILRRLWGAEFGYLNNYGLETELMRKQLGQDYDLLDDLDAPEDATDVIRRPMWLENEDGDLVEYAPHTVEAAAMAAVITRLDDDDDLLPEPDEEEWDDSLDIDDTAVSLPEKLVLYQRGYFTREDDDGDEHVLRKEQFQFPEDAREKGFEGLPITYTKRMMRLLTDQEFDRGSQDGINVENVVIPYDALARIKDGLSDELVVSDDNVEEYRNRIEQVEAEIDRMLEEDVLDAIFHDWKADEDSDIDKYRQMLEAIKDDTAQYTTESGRVVDEPDPLTLKETEKKLFHFDEDEYDGDAPKEDSDVQEFRDGFWNNYKNESWRNGDAVNYLDLEMVQERIGSFGWDGIPCIGGGTFNNFDREQWHEGDVIVFDGKDPMEASTHTEQVKNMALQNMVEHQDYTPESALLIADHVASPQEETD